MIWRALPLLLACLAQASGQAEQPLFSTSPLPQQRCGSPPTAGLELTDAERELLPHLCWPEDDSSAAATANDLPPQRIRSGVPAGVNCTVEQWCEGDTCADVCARGSVQVDRWLSHAIAQQSRLVQTLPLCYANLLGTHNSAITLADGYGALDEYFRGFFEYIKWAVSDFRDAPLHTNNQLLSLTDQLNLGVRSLEIDTHWVGGILRIAHCGGLHVPQLNKLIDAINFVAKLLHRRIRWDTETLGCVPSLSSIPAYDQRLLTDALQEVKAWMDRPENALEFVILYFDDQPNLQAWGVVGNLLADITGVFPREWVFSAEDREAFGAGWPSQQQMLTSGKRLLLVSGTDYGADMQPLIFSRGATLCGWNEPPLRAVNGVPDCHVGGDDPKARPLFDGLLTRVISCELEYGPLNCDFVWRGTNQPVFDEFTLPPVMGCGLNMPSPDLLTPVRAAAAIWTWAPGHPFDPSYGDDAQLGKLVQAASSNHGGEQSSNSSSVGGVGGSGVQAPAANCGVISAADSRWRAVPCSLPALPSACRDRNASLDAPDGGWVVDASLPRGDCPPGTQYDLPRHPRENYLLAAALQRGGHDAAWLPVHGPEWSTDGWPAERQQRQPTDKRRVLRHVGLPAAAGLLAVAALVSGVVLSRRLWLRRQRGGLYQALASE
ncbi:hypothetical protein ABPG77_008335 [Micractinium sp. CCAP 211/92]